MFVFVIFYSKVFFSVFNIRNDCVCKKNNSISFFDMPRLYFLFCNNSLPFNKNSSHFASIIIRILQWKKKKIFFFFFQKSHNNSYEKTTNLTSLSSKPNKEGRVDIPWKRVTHTFIHDLYESVFTLNQLILTLNKCEDTLQEIFEIIEAGHCQIGRFLRM